MGASLVTLLEARTAVRNQLDEPSAAEWTDAQLNSYINEGCSVVQRNAEAIQKVTSFAGVQNQQQYTAPSDTLRIYKLEFLPTDADTNYTLEYRGLQEMDQIWGTQNTWPSQWPLYYTLWRNPPDLTIIVYPVTAEAGTFNCYYYPFAVAATGDSDTIDCLPQWENVIYDYAIYRALRQDADPRWQDNYQIFTQELQDMIDLSRKFTDQAGTFSTGQQALPAWLTGAYPY